MIIHVLENVEQISSVNQLCCWLEAVTLRQLSVQACHSHRKRGEVALQSASDGQSNLLPLTLTQDTTVSLPIATNMLSLANRDIQVLKNRTHSERYKCACPQTHTLCAASHILTFSSLAMMTGFNVPSPKCHCKHADGKTEGDKTSKKKKRLLKSGMQI